MEVDDLLEKVVGRQKQCNAISMDLLLSKELDHNFLLSTRIKATYCSYALELL